MPPRRVHSPASADIALGLIDTTWASKVGGMEMIKAVQDTP